MTRFLIDSNVLLDVVTADPKWKPWSSNALAQCGDAGLLHINQIIYAEVSTRFQTVSAVEQAFPGDLFIRLDIPYEAAFLAGKAYAHYRAAGGTRTSPLPDFFIGAHAAVSGLSLVTRDAARYRTYFPTVSLIAPP